MRRRIAQPRESGEEAVIIRISERLRKEVQRARIMSVEV